jgi:hypothetical protein
MRREERHHSSLHNVRAKIATLRNVRTLREMSPRRIMTLTHLSQIFLNACVSKMDVTLFCLGILSPT